MRRETGATGNRIRSKLSHYPMMLVALLVLAVAVTNGWTVLASFAQGFMSIGFLMVIAAWTASGIRWFTLAHRRSRRLPGHA
jgi:hypothetical protein